MKLKPSLLLAATIAWFANGHTTAAEPAHTKPTSAWIDKRIQAWQPTKAERAFDDIAWAKDLRQAQRLAREHGRAIFVFTYDGASLAGYRC